SGLPTHLHGHPRLQYRGMVADMGHHLHKQHCFQPYLWVCARPDGLAKYHHVVRRSRVWSDDLVVFLLAGLVWRRILACVVLRVALGGAASGICTPFGTRALVG